MSVADRILTTPSPIDIRLPSSSPVVFCYLCPCECGCGGFGEVPRPGSGGYHADVTKESLLEWIRHVGPSIISKSLPALQYRHERRAFALELAVNHEDVRLVAFLLEDFIEESAKRKAVVEACKKANLTLVWTLLQKMRTDNSLMADCMLMILKNNFDWEILRQLREDSGDEVYGRALGQFAAVSGSTERIKKAVLEEHLDARHIPMDLAVASGDLELVQFLVERGAQADVKALAESIRLVHCHLASYFVYTLNIPMDEECFVAGCEIALKHGKLSCLEYIMNSEAPPYAKRHLDKLFLDACRLGSTLVVPTIHKWLQDAGSLPQEGLLITCAHLNDTTAEMIKLLVSFGANLSSNSGEAFVAACQSGNIPAVHVFFEQDKVDADILQRGALKAAEFGNKELLRRLVMKLGRFLNEQNGFLDDLLRCSLNSYERSNEEEERSKHRKVLFFLIDIGANVRLDNDRILIPAAITMDFSLMSRALELGADPESNDHEAFIQATEKNLEWIAVLMTDYGADLQARNNFCIRTTARLGTFFYFRFLSEKGGDMTVEDYECFKLAVENGHLNIVQLIWETGDPKPDAHRLLSTAIIKKIVESGQVPLMSYLLGQCNLRIQHISDIVISAVKSQSLEMYGLIRDEIADTWKLSDKLAALEASVQCGCYDIFNRLLGYVCKLSLEHRLKLFMMAVQEGNVDIIKHLIVPITDPRPIQVALVESAKLGHLDAVKFLIETNSSVFTKDCLNEALRAAIAARQLCIIELLLFMQDVDSDPNALAIEAIKHDGPGLFVIACRLGIDLKAVLKEIREESIGPLVGQAIQDFRDGFIKTHQKA